MNSRASKFFCVRYLTNIHAEWFVEFAFKWSHLKEACYSFVVLRSRNGSKDVNLWSRNGEGDEKQ